VQRGRCHVIDMNGKLRLPFLMSVLVSSSSLSEFVADLFIYSWLM
jgi:hypothetical protein